MRNLRTSDLLPLLKTRKEAIDLRERHYFTGNPCKHGHLAARATYSAKCIECNRIGKRKS